MSIDEEVGSTASKPPSARPHPQPANGRKDEWTFLPALAGTGILATSVFLCTLPGSLGFLLILLSGPVFLVAVLVILFSAGMHLVRRQRRAAASTTLALIIPVLLWMPINWAVVRLHLVLTVMFGVGQLGPTQVSDGGNFLVYDWSIGFAGSASTFLIFDKTDEIALPVPQHTRPISVENGWGEECAGRVRHVIGHYYICVTG